MHATHEGASVAHAGHRRAGLPSPWLVLPVLLVLCFLGLDGWVYEHISRTFNRGVLQDLYHQTTWLWDSARLFGHWAGVGIALVALVLLHPQGWRIGRAGLVVVVVAALAAILAQRSLGRVRPNHDATHQTFVGPTAWTHAVPVSFPSGEAAAAWAMAAVLWRAWPRAWPLFAALAILQCTARLLNGAHYLSDVLAGAWLGLAIVRGLLWRMM
jgi:membrane-associated phospholipid phosphatase